MTQGLCLSDKGKNVSDNSITRTRDAAKAFAASHAKALAHELIQWHDTGLLPDGKFRELAANWANADEQNAMSLAESTATRAALDALVVNFHAKLTHRGCG